MTFCDSFYVVALGGNLADDCADLAAILRQAVIRLARERLMIRSVSRFFRTPCFPEGAGPDYVNAAVLIESELSAVELLAVLHEIEAEFGRERTQRWGARTLDLDLLARGDLVMPDVAEFLHWQGLDPQLQARAVPDTLIVPHPRIQDRGFVLVPFCDIAPEWRHPVLGKTARQLLDELPQTEVRDIVPV